MLKKIFTMFTSNKGNKDSMQEQENEQFFELKRLEFENTFDNVGYFDLKSKVAPVRNKGKMGLMNSNGDFLIPFGEYSIKGFSEGKTSVSKYINGINNIQIIDTVGEEIKRFTDLYHFGDFKNDTVIAQKNTEMYGKYNANWEIVIPFEYSYIENLDDNSMLVSNYEHNWWAVINNENEFTIPPIFTAIQHIDFVNKRVIRYKDAGYGIFDFKGNILRNLGNEIGFESIYIDGKHYKEREGVILIKDGFSGKNYSLVDTNFNTIVPFGRFLKISDINEGMVRVAGQINTQVLGERVSMSHFSNCGFLNLKGEMIIPMKFDFAGYFKEGLCVASINKKYGYINKNGDFVIEPQYDYCLPFNKGYAKVQIGNKFYIIDKQGNKIMKSKHY